jgi:sulfite exporter TauE/SafE
MRPPLGQGRIAQFICGVVMIILAFTVFCRARVAEERHQVVPSYRFATWMSPPQAYVASGLCFVGGVVIIALGIAATRRERQERNDANI